MVSDSNSKGRWQQCHLYICSLMTPSQLGSETRLGSCRPCADTAGLASFHMGGEMHWVTLPMMHFCLAQGGGWGIPRVSVTAWETPLSHRWHHQSRDPPAAGVMRYTTSNDCDMSIPVIGFCGLFTWSCFPKTSGDPRIIFFWKRHFFFPGLFPLPFPGLSWHDFSCLKHNHAVNNSNEFPFA